MNYIDDVIRKLERNSHNGEILMSDVFNVVHRVGGDSDVVNFVSETLVEDGYDIIETETGVYGSEGTLEDMGSILLTYSEEIDLSKRIKKGDKEALTDLIVSNRRLVLFMAKKYINRGLSYSDLVQEGSIGLIKAAKRYDWRKGTRFSTYATWYIMQSILLAIRNTGSLVRYPVYMSDTYYEYKKYSKNFRKEHNRYPTKEETCKHMGITGARYDNLIDSMNKRDVSSLNQLVGEEEDVELGELIADDRYDVEKDVVVSDRDSLLWSIVNEVCNEREVKILKLRFIEDKKLEQCGVMFNITRERARQIQNRALKKVRNALMLRGLSKEDVK